MLVQELITKLQGLNHDAKVFIRTPHNDWTDALIGITSIEDNDKVIIIINYFEEDN